MNVLDYFKRKKTASVAKDRLRIIIAQERSEANRPDYLPTLRKEILQVVAKYTKTDLSKVNVELHQHNHDAVLELNVVLPNTHESAK